MTEKNKYTKKTSIKFNQKELDMIEEIKKITGARNTSNIVSLAIFELYKKLKGEK